MKRKCRLPNHYLGFLSADHHVYSVKLAFFMPIKSKALLKGRVLLTRKNLDDHSNPSLPGPSIRMHRFFLEACNKGGVFLKGAGRP